TVHSSRIYILEGALAPEQIAALKNYIIYAVDSLEIPVAAITGRRESCTPADVAILSGFTTDTPSSIKAEHGLAMSAGDVAFCQRYFRDEEKRDPSITELKMLDTYWSDHCRHTTFLTKIDEVTFDDPAGPAARAWQTYQNVRKQLGRDDKPVTLMDIALIGMRELRASGELDNLEVSEEVNAASIVVPVTIHDPQSTIHNTERSEEWLVMFKNETHNHPTEIEPFGGAATGLGGCIRDPLSGRSYVYQAMRVTGAGDPNTPFSESLPGKLPQKKICRIAAHGYSSYGNQIGLATGQVAEVYHPGYVAKRMEIGAVVAAAPRSQVFRGTPAPGDVILLIGGRTGRDGVGGATGSSKEHDDSALENSAEVQKGDAPTERKIQRLFRNPELTRKIKICNDFGAGGVSVAIGEIAPSLLIALDAVPKKYDGLDGTELAISESQERMAVCVDPAEIDYFIAEADKENLECVKVADVTDSGRLVMTWRGKTIVNLSRAFLNTNGVQQSAKVHVTERGLQSATSPTLTPTVSSHHEQRTSLLERSTSQGFASRLGGDCQPILDILTRVHRASQKAGIPEPKNRQERIELERAIRKIEERELRSIGFPILNAADFNQKWARQGKISGAEQRVYLEEQECSVIKANDGNFHGNWLQYLERLHLHQLLFPETACTFLGLLVEDSGISMVVRQPFAKASDGIAGATRDEVEAWMRDHFGAFRYKNDDYYLPQLDLLIEDLHDENVLVSENRKALLV
ncbi:MAG TPA: AIR synthase-related protein, partial [Luteolibacter sp.]|nr:AIR synthase-related protein [Luteolibacter sp.]